MHKEVVILIAEDDPGHAALIEKNLRRSGIHNEIICFCNGQELLDFLFMRTPEKSRTVGVPYILLLDIRMPEVDGIEALRQIKADSELKKIPVIMLTTTDDPKEVQRCHELGCGVYITKPVEYDKFVQGIMQLGLFLVVIQVPVINNE